MTYKLDPPIDYAQLRKDIWHDIFDNIRTVDHAGSVEERCHKLTDRIMLYVKGQVALAHPSPDTSLIKQIRTIAEESHDGVEVGAVCSCSGYHRIIALCDKAHPTPDRASGWQARGKSPEELAAYWAGYEDGESSVQADRAIAAEEASSEMRLNETQPLHEGSGAGHDTAGSSTRPASMQQPVQITSIPGELYETWLADGMRESVRDLATRCYFAGVHREQESRKQREASQSDRAFTFATPLAHRHHPYAGEVTHDRYEQVVDRHGRVICMVSVAEAKELCRAVNALERESFDGVSKCEQCDGLLTDMKVPWCRCCHPGIIGWEPTPDENTRRG